MQLHTGQFKYYCELCRKGFNNDTNFKTHIREQEGKRYKREYCDKSYSNEINLKYHLSIHTGQYRLRCTLCGEGFNEGKLYEAHLKGHSRWVHTDAILIEMTLSTHRKVSSGTKILSPFVTTICKLFRRSINFLFLVPFVLHVLCDVVKCNTLSIRPIKYVPRLPLTSYNEGTYSCMLFFPQNLQGVLHIWIIFSILMHFIVCLGQHVNKRKVLWEMLTSSHSSFLVTSVAKYLVGSTICKHILLFTQEISNGIVKNVREVFRRRKIMIYM